MPLTHFLLLTPLARLTYCVTLCRNARDSTISHLKLTNPKTHTSWDHRTHFEHHHAIPCYSNSQTPLHYTFHANWGNHNINTLRCAHINTCMCTSLPYFPAETTKSRPLDPVTHHDLQSPALRRSRADPSADFTSPSDGGTSAHFCILQKTIRLSNILHC